MRLPTKLPTLSRDSSTCRLEVISLPHGKDGAAILGSIASKLKQTGKVITTDFAIVLPVANGEIGRFQMLENSFVVSQAARG